MHSEANPTAVSKPNVCTRLVEIVVDRLGHADHAQAGLVQALGDGQRTVAADRHEGVDVADGEQLDELVGAVDLDVAAVGLAHRVGGRVAAVGRAEDRAAEVDDAAHGFAGQLDNAAVAVALRVDQPVEAVADADDVPARGCARRAQRRGSRR